MHRQTEEEPVQDAPRATEESFQSLAEHVPVQIWTARPDGLLDYVTEQTARHFGLTAARLLDEGWQNVVHPDDLASAVAKWTHALTTGETYEAEFRLKLHDGRYAWHLARAVPQRSASGSIVRWFGTNTDIEELREAQRRMQALLDEVGRQTQESVAVIDALTRERESARARIAELETRLGRSP